jgi:hypothetical protein
MLTTLSALQLLPNLKAVNGQWLAQLLNEADAAIKRWCKRDLELTSYPGNATNGTGDAGYYIGMSQPDLILRQRPVLNPQTTIAVGSNNVALPTATINVGSTTGFNPSGGTLSIYLGTTYQPGSTSITYTGLTSTTFTGCSGGSGTLTTGQQVGAIAVWYDPQGMGGQYPGSFGTATLLTQGLAYSITTDTYFGNVAGAERGLVRRAGYQALYGGFGGWGGGYGYGNWGRDAKLSAREAPYWPDTGGQQCFKVAYLAGYPTIPPDLAYACQNLVSYMVLTVPYGGLLQSETLGSYSYSLLAQAQKGAIPQLGGTVTTLARYRETSIGGS